MSGDNQYREFVNAAAKGDVDSIRDMLTRRFNPVVAYESVEQAVTVKRDAEGKVIACCVRVADDAFMQAILANQPEVVNLLKEHVWKKRQPAKRIPLVKELSVPPNNIALFAFAFRKNAYRVIAESVPAEMLCDLTFGGETPMRFAVKKGYASMASVLARRNGMGLIGSVQDAKDLLFVVSNCFSEDDARVSFLSDIGRKELERILEGDKELYLVAVWELLLKAYLKIKEREGVGLRHAKVETLFSVPGDKKILAAEILLGEAQGKISPHIINQGFLGLINRLKNAAERGAGPAPGGAAK